jgi:hypothetical protein
MDLINEAIEIYKNSYLLLIMNIFYNYIDYFLCILYLGWYLLYIIVNQKLKEFANENYINYYLIFYSFYKIHSFVKQKQNIRRDIIFSTLFIVFISLDFINKNTIHPIQYWILYNLAFSIFIFTYGTLYMFIKSDFQNYNNSYNNSYNSSYNSSDDNYIELISEIISDTV